MISDGRIYFGSGDKLFYCLDAKSGKKFWDYKTESAIRCSPVILENKVFFGSGDNKLYCLNKNNGNIIWEYLTTFEGYDYNNQYSFAISKGKLFFGKYDDNLFYCIDTETGKKIWDIKKDYYVNGTPIVSENKILFGFSCFDINNTTKIWEYEASSYFMSSPISFANGCVFLEADNGCVYCLESQDSDSTPPEIKLLKPESTNSSLPAPRQYTIEFTATDESEIESATVNGIKAEFVKDEQHPDGHYSCKVQLQQGLNTFIIKVTDKSTSKNTSSLVITINVPVTNTTNVEIKEPMLANNDDYSKWFSSTQNVNIGFKDIKFELPKTTSNLVVSRIEEMQKCSVPGLPEIPTFAVTYKIPKNLDFVSYDIKFDEVPISLDGSLVTPTMYQFPLPAGGKPYVMPDREEYGLKSPIVKPKRSSVKPSSARNIIINPAVGGNPYRWPPELNFADSHEVVIFVRPARYSKDDNSLYYMLNLQINIKTEIKKDDVTSSLIKPSFLNIFEPYDMCIISNSNLIGSDDGKMDDFADYAKWKTTNGVTTKCFDINDIYSKYDTMPTDYMKMQAFIQNERKFSDVKFVLLGGDDTVVPATKVYAQAESNKVIYKAMIASDSYYSQSTSDWGNIDYENQSMIGNNRSNIDIKPNVFVGRVPVKTGDELVSFITKMTGYSSSAYSDEYNKKVLLWGKHLYESSFGGDYLDQCIKDLPSNGQNYVRLYDNPPQSGLPYTKYENDEFAAEFIGKESPHIIAIDSHGSNYSIDTFDSSYVDKLKNSTPGYIVSSTSCNVAQFSKSMLFSPVVEDMFDGSCIADKLFLKSEGGALAYVGNSSNGWFCPGYPGYSISSLYQEYFLKNLLRTDELGQSMTLGQAFWNSKILCYSSLEKGVFDEYGWWVYNSLNLLGDPSFTPKMNPEVDSLELEPIESNVDGYVSFKLKAYSKVCKEVLILDSRNINWLLFPKNFGSIAINGLICSVIANKPENKGYLFVSYRDLKTFVTLPYSKKTYTLIITPASVKLKLSGASLKLSAKIIDTDGKEINKNGFRLDNRTAPKLLK